MCVTCQKGLLSGSLLRDPEVGVVVRIEPVSAMTLFARPGVSLNRQTGNHAGHRTNENVGACIKNNHDNYHMAFRLSCYVDI